MICKNCKNKKAFRSLTIEGKEYCNECKPKKESNGINFIPGKGCFKKDSKSTW